MQGASQAWPAVTGLGAWTGLGPDVAALWSGLSMARSALAPVLGLGDAPQEPSLPVAQIAELSQDQPYRALRLAEQAAQEALQDAGWDEARRRDPSALLVLSTTKAEIAVAQDILRRLRPVADLQRGFLFSLAPHLAQALGWRGPVLTVSVACASGLAALEVARQHITRGAASRALVVGVDTVSDFVYRGFEALRALDPKGARPFDAQRGGLSLGEGAVALTLEPDRPGHAQLLGYGASNDAHHITGPARDGRGLKQALKGALKGSAGQVAFAVAHGTGTVYNDAMEGQAYQAVLDRVPLTAIKGGVGHLMGAAGLANVIVAICGLKAQACPPISRLSVPDPEIDLDIVQGTLREVQGGVALVSASGFAGVNAALCLGAQPAARPRARNKSGQGAWVRGWSDGPADRAAQEARVGTKAARRLDDLCLLGLGAAQAALEHAELTAEDFARGPHGLVLGTALGCLESDYSFYTGALKTEGPPSNPRVFAYTLSNIVLGELAIRHGFTGENLVVSAGRVSGLAALCEAAGRIESGAWSTALVLMVEAVGPAAQVLATALPRRLRPRASAVVLQAEPKGARAHVRGRLIAHAIDERGGPEYTGREPEDPLGAAGWDDLLGALGQRTKEGLRVACGSGYAVHLDVGPS